MKKLILIGGGGHARSCLEVIELTKEFQVVGIVDRKENIGNKILNYKIEYSDEDLEKLVNPDHYFFIAIGQIKSPDIRINIFEKLSSLGAQMPTIISPLAHVSKNSIIEEGSIVMNFGLVNSGARIGKNCIINNRALVEHDAVVEDHCHLAPGSILNGESKLGMGSFLGSMAVTEQTSVFGERSLLQAGEFHRRKL